jgi:hypothetical protein
MTVIVNEPFSDRPEEKILEDVMHANAHNQWLFKMIIESSIAGIIGGEMTCSHYW